LKSRLVVPLLVICVLLALFLFSYIQNNRLSITRLTVSSGKIPSGFNGFRIVHLSDLHGKNFGFGQRPLLGAVRRQRPDIIVFTGDMIDSDTPGDRLRSLTLMRGLMKIAPVYWVTGNNDRVPDAASLEDELTAAGVNVLNNRGLALSRSGQSIWLSGIDDPLFGSPSGSRDTEAIVNENMDRSLQERPAGLYSLLLSHRPEILPFYARKGFDLIFAGHAHGGQIRLPFLGPLYAPDQGFFPKLTEGAHREGNSVMVISRGLGNSVIPQRLFNRPEVVVVTLQAAP